MSKISSYGKIWLRLRKLMQDLGSSTGFTYGGQTLLFFTMSLLLSYGFMVELEDNFNYAALTTALLFQAVIFSQCNSAQNASNEVSALNQSHHFILPSTLRSSKLSFPSRVSN
jgi:phosphatidylglycerophosphate synthase